jgi:hypothetical protein
VADRVSEQEPTMPDDTTTTATRQRRLSRLESTELARVATTVTGWKLSRRQYGSTANVSGVRTRTRTFSRRLDSRTVFAHDERCGYGRKAGAWTGDDDTARDACRRVLAALEIPDDEIAALDVVSEMGQVAQRVDETEFRISEPTTLRKLARATRAVEGVPVWSSHAMVGLTETGEVGTLEVHWPELPAAAVKEANMLGSLVSPGFEAPKLDLALVEAVEAGIVHSPAVGFHLDVIPVIRVIYLGDEPAIGRKAMLYVDRHGELVEAPRDIKPNEPSGEERPAKT